MPAGNGGSRLKHSSLEYVSKAPRYRLEFQEGYGHRSDPEPARFDAPHRPRAFAHMRKILKIKGPLRVEKFFEAGGKVFFKDGVQIFPRKQSPAAKK